MFVLPSNNPCVPFEFWTIEIYLQQVIEIIRIEALHKDVCVKCDYIIKIAYWVCFVIRSFRARRTLVIHYLLYAKLNALLALGGCFDDEKGSVTDLFILLKVQADAELKVDIY